MADTTVGAKLVLDAGGAVKSMKEFKQEVKDARTDLLNIQATFGATSKEALNAAKRVAELEDNIKDASETTKLFDPGNKFAVMGNAVRGLVGGFTALQGALALVGVEGEDVQKTLLKVQGALALTEGLNTVADVTKDFKRLGAVLVQTLGKAGLAGIAIAGAVAIGLALSGVFTRKQRDDVAAYNDTLKDYVSAAAEARKKVVEVSVAFEQARQGVISKDQALKIYNDTLGDSLGRTNDINKAEKLLADKAETYIKITALKAQANALFTKAAEQTANALVEQDKLIKSGILDDNSVFSRVADRANSRIEDAKQGAKDIEKIGADLLRQAGQLSKAFDITTGAPTATPKTTTTKNPKEAEEERLAIVKRVEFQLKSETDFTDAYIDELLKREAADDAAATKKAQVISMGRDLSISAATDIIAANQRQAESVRQLAMLEEGTARARVSAAQAVGNALGALAELVGRQTAAGKALAIAQAVINTWVGVSEVLRAKSVLPEPFATIAKIANITAIVATGLNAVKNIAKTQVPGGGSSGGANIGNAQTQAPLQPQAPGATNTLLNQQQLNQIGNAASRAFVLETDITTSIERTRRLNRAARI